MWDYAITIDMHDFSCENAMDNVKSDADHCIPFYENLGHKMDKSVFLQNLMVGSHIFIHVPDSWVTLIKRYNQRPTGPHAQRCF